MYRSLRILLISAVTLSVHAQSPLYGQCGGTGWNGDKACVSGAVCTVLNQWYSQCLPGTGAPAPSTTIATATLTTTSTTLPTGAECAVPPASAGSLELKGVNIAGFDFGCATDGFCNTTGAWPPLTQLGGNDGEGQMKHFFNTDGFNTFRLPVGWQYLTNNVVGGDLNEANFQKYDTLVKTCLNIGATCVIDIHNYARWNGGIIGQGGPTNEQFAALWSSLASRYKDQSKLIFGLVNEPHDVPDIKIWAASVQAAVTAIRKAGATQQIILLPGNNWTSAGTFISSGSADALKTVVNLDGSTTNLVFDVHKYLDSDNSGTHTECTTNNIDGAWKPLAEWLRCNGRKAFNTETGGGNTQSCVKYTCEQTAYQAANSDVYLGYVGWSAGNFADTYELNEVPTYSNGKWTDTLLVSSCLSPKAGYAGKL
uniref:cellulase n=1 Tax=Flammulina velutipes TaxID=38945 RepID=G8A530_FLAVE|nr:putative endoglucanase [Flammulina velutipes]